MRVDVATSRTTMSEEDDIPGKVREIHALLASASSANTERLRQMAVLPGGLLTNKIRQQAWPRILDINPFAKHDEPTEEDMKEHRDARVVDLDVERLLKRYPPDLDSEVRDEMQDVLKRVIMRTLHGTDYHYYQGFHDIAITVHLVLRDENLTVAVLRKLCQTHFRVFMTPTLLDTVTMLQFIYPLIRRCNPHLHDFLIRSDIGTMFALPWLITWYSHNIQENVPLTLVVRLCDLFIASDPHMPIYLGAAIVNSLSHRILSLPEDQAEVHGFLNYLPTTLSWETLIKDALDLYLQFPPATIAPEAERVPFRKRLAKTNLPDQRKSHRRSHPNMTVRG
ncbi:TBC1 domain family member 20-like isoform X2 [Paramacrobiotus metropolitanus]|uniref:TBC1 domain family member 20-like isoform X2 n=1 Tax=Paramacrobiotus metropolitanus TaxID=2943436 RepID=UPI002445D7C8|nr:TBC1 domain family member 20-like isoform X2 [Paramacrobiotus metropolitanus]